MSENKITKAEQARQDVAEALDTLRHTFPKGSTVHTITRHVSASGTSRDISAVAVDRETLDIYGVSHRVALVLGRRLSERNGGMAVVCRGGGMDMAFDLVYSLSMALYGDGYALQHRSI